MSLVGINQCPQGYDRQSDRIGGDSSLSGYSGLLSLTIGGTIINKSLDETNRGLLLSETLSSTSAFYYNVHGWDCGSKLTKRNDSLKESGFLNLWLDI